MNVYKDIVSLSSGTISNLIKNTNYEAIDKAQQDMADFLKEATKKYETWHEVWHDYSVGKHEGSSRTASEESAFDYIIPFQKWEETLRKVMKMGDKQTEDLLIEIADHFDNKFKITGDEKYAINILLGLSEKSNLDPANTRNLIFKAANVLKIKLPSSSF